MTRRLWICMAISIASITTSSALAAQAAPQSGAAVEDGENCPPMAGVQRWAAANITNFDGDYSAFCGDFTGDGVPDVFSVIRSPTGGNSSYQDAVLFQNSGGQMRFLRRVPEFFGETKRAVFALGKVTLEMSVLRPGDPRCCPSGTERREVDVATGRHAAVSAGRSGISASRAPAPVVQSAHPQGIVVDLRFSPRAAAMAAGRTGQLWTWWGGEPLPARLAAARSADLLDEDAMLELGFTRRDVPARSGQVAITPTTFNARYGSWVRQVMVNAGFDAKHPSLNCAVVTSVPLSVARSRPVTVNCKVLGER